MRIPLLVYTTKTAGIHVKPAAVRYRLLHRYIETFKIHFDRTAFVYAVADQSEGSKTYRGRRNQKSARPFFRQIRQQFCRSLPLRFPVGNRYERTVVDHK